MTGSIPLSVLDLLPIKAGATPRTAVSDALDLARHVEAFGYHRYWVAEHHLTPGVASSAPAVAIALVAGERGLPFAANYHISPATVLESIEGYRAAFRPSAVRDRPHVAVSADVVVASDDRTARRLASPYALWVRSIRTGAGAIPYPSPDDAAAHEWTDADSDVVADRVETQFVGTPTNVARQLEILAAETGADELVITTITHDHGDPVRSYQLLAQEWSARAARSPVTTQARLAGAGAVAVAGAAANGGESTRATGGRRRCTSAWCCRGGTPPGGVAASVGAGPGAVRGRGPGGAGPDGRAGDA
jgi:alkanesulfonate monooxygenase SsuD/methylene tetrahydromethanopterin reductase-like flavin-dependent oxidoreductase (luciferase family)